MTKQYFSTSKAAEILGVSVGTVQHMVESGKLDAWKTAGGHRRITADSVYALSQHTNEHETNLNEPGKLDIVIVEDDAVLLASYEKMLERIPCPMNLLFFNNGMDAMLHLGRQFPRLLLLDLELPYVDGFEMLNSLKYHQGRKNKHIVVISGLSDEELHEKRQLLEGLTVLRKPVSYDLLKGYVLALRDAYSR